MPTVVVLLLVVLFLFISWLSYRKLSTIPVGSRYALMILRASTLIIIFLLLLNPFFYSLNEVEVKPNIAVFLDNSESVDIEKGQYMGLNSYNELLSELQLSERNITDLEFYTFGEEVRPVEDPLPDATDTQTNLSDPIQSLLEMENDVQAAILISDGIISFGRNPSVSAYNSTIPIYTIALGDTAKVRDISISNVLTNATGYTDTRHIVEVEITQSGFSGYSTMLNLSSGNQNLDQKEITFRADDEVKTITFELPLEEPGLQTYELRILPLEDEWTSENNDRVFNIDVLDGKTRILHVAMKIHPDVKAVRRVLEEDISIELSTLTWLGGDRFVEDTSEQDEFDLIILHGLSENLPDFNFWESVTEVPTVLFDLERTTSNLELERSGIQLIRFPNTSLASVSLIQQQDATDQAILELPEIDLNETPLLFAPLRTTLKEPGAQALYNLRFDGLETSSPALAIQEVGNMRRTHILPWGWFRLLQNTDANQRAYFEQLITNIVSWTASDPDNRLLRISPSKSSFRTSDNPTINGSLQNERGEPEIEGIIEFELITDDEAIRSFNMEHIGSGNYRLSLPRLSEGRYNYEATARKGNRELDTQSGEFLVANTSSELTNTRRNDALLRNMAENSGGDFFTYESASAIWDSLETKGLLMSQTEEVENYLFPIRSVYWFLLVLLLLGSEWMLRKYYSLP